MNAAFRELVRFNWCLYPPKQSDVDVDDEKVDELNDAHQTTTNAETQHAADVVCNRIILIIIIAKNE